MGAPLGSNSATSTLSISASSVGVSVVDEDLREFKRRRSSKFEQNFYVSALMNIYHARLAFADLDRWHGVNDFRDVLFCLAFAAGIVA
jgi:hypothetical protein